MSPHGKAKKDIRIPNYCIIAETSWKIFSQYVGVPLMFINICLILYHKLLNFLIKTIT